MITRFFIFDIKMSPIFQIIAKIKINIFKIPTAMPAVKQDINYGFSFSQFSCIKKEYWSYFFFFTFYIMPLLFLAENWWATDETT